MDFSDTFSLSLDVGHLVLFFLASKCRFLQSSQPFEDFCCASRILFLVQEGCDSLYSFIYFARDGEKLIPT